MKNMMKFYSILIAIIFTACSDSGYVQSEDATDSDRTCDPISCYIYYDSFSFQRVYGLLEKQILNHAIRYDFDYKDLISILKDTVPSTYQSGCKASGYCDGDIKVKIVLHDDIFFVDSMGYMRKDKLIYQIDKNSLQELMEMKEKNN